MKRAYGNYIFGAMILAACGFLIGWSVPKHSAEPSLPMVSAAIPLAPAARPIPMPTFHPTITERDYYDAAYATAERYPFDAALGPVRAVTVNHHLLAARIIADTMRYVGTSDPRVIVLVSPNHFSAGAGDVITSDGSWQTAYGDLAADAGVIAALVRSGSVTVENQPFIKEHGIGNIVSFIKRSAPRATIVPIILRDSMKAEQVDSLARELKASLPPGAVMVTSVDFSHYLPPGAARLHDEKSLRLLRAGSIDGLSALDVDSQPAIRLTLDFVGRSKFTLLHHTDAAAVTGQDLDETTSYIDGAFTASEPSPAHGATMLVFGDVMLDRHVRDTIKDKGLPWIFAPLKRLFLGNDIVLANLEGPITDFPSVANHSDLLKFTFDPTVAAYLKRIGFTTFSLANNHARDFGAAGVDLTRATLVASGLEFFGSYFNDGPISRVDEVGGMKIGFIGYNAFGGDGGDRVLDEVRRLDPLTDYVVIMPHWGVEYSRERTLAQQKLARAWIDAGADLVVGSHPHVVEPIEVYKGRAIFFSLGNFVFDQGFSKETQEGLGVGVSFSPDGIAFSLLPTEQHDIQVSLSASAARAKMFTWIADHSDAPASVITAMRSGQFTLSTH